MNGSATGLEPANPSREDDIGRLYEAVALFNRAAKAACDFHEHKLQREAEDACARLISQVERIEREEVQQRRVDGENPQAAGEKEG